MNVRRLANAWGWYVAGAVTVLLGIYLYARRLYFEFEVERPRDDE